MLVVVAPGQGAQTPGFLLPWLDAPGVRERLEWLSAVSGVDLITHGTTSDADTIRDTAVAQPLIVGAGLVTLLSLFPHPSTGFTQIGAGAGHSVGEITAAVGAGVLSAEQAMVFVRERGKAMVAAAAVTETGMSAVLGGDTEEVLAKAKAHGLTTLAHENHGLFGGQHPGANGSGNFTDGMPRPGADLGESGRGVREQTEQGD